MTNTRGFGNCPVLPIVQQSISSRAVVALHFHSNCAACVEQGGLVAVSSFEGLTEMPITAITGYYIGS